MFALPSLLQAGPQLWRCPPCLLRLSAVPFLAALADWPWCTDVREAPALCSWGGAAEAEWEIGNRHAFNHSNVCSAAVVQHPSSQTEMRCLYCKLWELSW